MLFITFSNANVYFAEKKLTWRSYTITKTPPNTKKIELIYKKEFAKIALHVESKAFVMHLSALKTLLSKFLVYLGRAA